MKNKYGIEEWNTQPVLTTEFNSPVWSVIQIQNSINKSLADEHITYEEWKKFMSICSDILERITV